MQRPIPAVFMRGGTSKAIMFHARDLPEDRAAWDELFTAAMGVADPYGRQLDGMGGGVSSVSKVCVLAPSARDDADIDYTFAQVQVRESKVDYKGNCGNMSSAVGPFAVDEGLVRASGDSATVRIFNTNTQKDHSRHVPAGGRAGPLRRRSRHPRRGRHGRAGAARFCRAGRRGHRQAAAIRQDDRSARGAGLRCDRRFAGRCGQSAVFVRARDIGLTGTELPEQLEANPKIMRLIEDIRVQGSVRMGIAPDAGRRAP